MSNFNVQAAPVRNHAASSSPSARASEKSATPSFSRSATANSLTPTAVKSPLDERANGKSYRSEPYPGKPNLASGCMHQGKLLNPSFVHEALNHDLKRLANDLRHGKTEKAADRVMSMSHADISDHLQDFKIDPQLVAKLRQVTSDTKLTPQQMQSAVHEIFVESGAARFLELPL
ncbi:MAG: hypothetical protein ACRYGA_04160 [Janthinobacterium lividum]